MNIFLNSVFNNRYYWNICKTKKADTFNKHTNTNKFRLLISQRS